MRNSKKLKHGKTEYLLEKVGKPAFRIRVLYSSKIYCLDSCTNSSARPHYFF